MKCLLKRFLKLFIFGGLLYVGVEMVYRKRSHISMFACGGLGLYLIDVLCNRTCFFKQKHLLLKGIVGCITITTLELLTGLLVNKKYTVWDYTKVPFNFKGQICLPYSCAWYAISLPAIYIAKLLK